jgi:hypothetical protein
MNAKAIKLEFLKVDIRIFEYIGIFSSSPFAQCNSHDNPSLFNNSVLNIPCRRSFIVVTIILMLSELYILACLPRKEGRTTRKQS